MKEQEVVWCNEPECKRVAEFTCDHCGQPFCSLHVAFDQVTAPGGWRNYLTTRRAHWSVISRGHAAELNRSGWRSYWITLAIIGVVVLLPLCICLLLSLGVLASG